VTSAEPVILDCTGLRCPLPVITLAKRWGEIPTGGEVIVVADDPAAATDVAAWCRMRGEEFLGALEMAGRPAYHVRRAS